ncbi:phenylpropionate dioxygenase-like ring-hydroxylating dioxygenase large terminal subunit [Scopulibacillus darangshiensis]|uniref:Phenylpropionate dioxygenase-like ring-hydroxylating dioxygenase large terminal subunit n=1 Tax=Scopulibacillus darangshiensis TaxID=442528 RepID=A0A4R2PBD5_9BACL|nr:aromatic ring-hydroxylating dioxygenase subunit alpha [Scopulibacillus darangshiensis]TCP31708.1 phenylpropionate dioxygenase-like ring-hydroxylating dioxygenase large terminal subunit [Scopulibacillus darangshiensis]
MIKTDVRLDDMTRGEIVRYLENTVEPEEGIIPAYIMSDPAVYDLEHEKVFLKTWLFLGHESEIPNNGDFVTRDLAGYSVIVSRNQDGVIRAFYNMCTHRGMKLCRADKGNKARFTCPYHGFTFKNSGELIGVPMQKDIYGGKLDFEAMGLHQVTIETYKGLIFGTFNDTPQDFSEFLGDFKWYLDIAVGRTDMEVVGPPQKFIINSQWKIGADNFVSDSYHTMVTHGSIAKLGMVPNATYSKKGYQVHTENGHGCNIGMPNPDFAFPEELIPEYKAHLSPQQFDMMADLKNMIGTIFPNLSFLVSHTEVKGKLISNTTVRLWRPIAVDKMEVITWFLVEKNASEDWKHRSRESYILTFSPSGIFEQDDTEVFTDITGAASGHVPFAKNYTYNYTMGKHRVPVKDFLGPGIVYDDKFTEANSRSYYRYWLDLMKA